MDNNYVNIFSIMETPTVTNSDVIVTITPNIETSRYIFTIYKDNNAYYTDEIHSNEAYSARLDETGTYYIEVRTYDSLEKENLYVSGKYEIDKEKPVITLSKNRAVIKQNDSNIDIDIKAIDNFDGDISSSIVMDESIDLSKVGTNTVTYRVSDKAGNVATKQAVVIVKQDFSSIIYTIDIALVSAFLIICVLFIRYFRSVKLEKKIAKYAIEPLHDKSLSMFDKFFGWYFKLVDKLVPYFGKSVFITKYSKRFERYIKTIDNHHKDAISFVVTKTFIGIIFLMIAIISKTLQSEVLLIYEILIPFTVGFFLLDVLYFTKYKVYRSQVENDLLQSIIIMNNAFKSGRSIVQAIDLVASELDGPIAEEFKKMSLEMSFGLAIEDVFKRFSERIKLPEVSYLTASLSILNRTGGNIIKVFSSIEKTLFNKKKLNIELKALTGSSKIIVYILFIVPIVFVAFISFVDPTYFLPLVTTPLGLIISSIVIVVYIVYIFVIRKVMKVRM